MVFRIRQMRGSFFFCAKDFRGLIINLNYMLINNLHIPQVKEIKNKFIKLIEDNQEVYSFETPSSSYSTISLLLSLIIILLFLKQ